MAHCAAAVWAKPNRELLVNVAIVEFFPEFFLQAHISINFLGNVHLRVLHKAKAQNRAMRITSSELVYIQP